jgi:hypothetical protein
MTKISKIYQRLTKCRTIYSVILLSVIFLGFVAPNLVAAQQQTTDVPGNATTAGNNTSDITSQSPSQTLGQALPGNDSTQSETKLEPSVDQPFVWRGLITSKIDGLPSPEDDVQSAIILPLRDDNGIYAGTLTYQANSPVDLTVWNNAAPGISTAIPEDLGDIEDMGVIENKTVIPTVVTSGPSGSVPFLGNALELRGDDETPFVATYAISAYAANPERISNLTNTGNMTAEFEEEDN